MSVKGSYGKEFIVMDGGAHHNLAACLPATRPGDLIAVLQSGAYGLTASPCELLSHPTPAEVLVEHGNQRLIREGGTSSQPIASLP